MTEAMKIEDTPQSDTPQAVSTDEPSYGMKLKKGFGKIKALFVEEEEIFPTYMPTSTDNGKKKTVWKVPYRLIFGTAFILVVLAAISISMSEGKNVNERDLLKKKKNKKKKKEETKEQAESKQKKRHKKELREVSSRKMKITWTNVTIAVCTGKSCEDAWLFGTLSLEREGKKKGKKKEETKFSLKFEGHAVGWGHERNYKWTYNEPAEITNWEVEVAILDKKGNVKDVLSDAYKVTTEGGFFLIRKNTVNKADHRGKEIKDLLLKSGVARVPEI